MCMCVRVCVWKNTENLKENPEKCVWYGCVVWCCEVRNTKKKRKTHWENCHGPPKWPENGHFSQRIVFTLSLGFTDVFGRRVLFQTAKNAFLGPRSYSKGLNQALEKVLTNETPGLHSPARFLHVDLQRIERLHACPPWTPCAFFLSMRNTADLLCDAHTNLFVKWRHNERPFFVKH